VATVRILVIEDVPDDAELTIHYVRKGRIAWCVGSVSIPSRRCAMAFVSPTERQLSDFSLPISVGLALR